MKSLTQGSIPRHILSLSIPTMLGLLLQSFYDLVDMFWIGKISSEAIAAITLFAMIFWLVEILNEIIGTGSVSLLSQNYGSGDIQAVAEIAEQTITFKFLIGLISGLLLAIGLKPLILIFSSDQKVLTYALEYGYLRAVTMPVFFSSYSVNTIFRCTGDAKTPMYLLIFSSVLNIVLDPVFMFAVVPGTTIPGLNLGMTGAAIATVISYSAAFLAGLVLLFRKNNRLPLSLKGLATLNMGISKKLFTIGLPSGVEMLFRNGANAAIVFLAATYGTTAVAIMGIGNRIYGFLFMPILGLLMGSSAIVGQNLGAGRIDRAVKTAWYSACMGMGTVSVLTLILLIYPKTFLGLFLENSEEILLGAQMLRIMAPAFIFAAFGLGLAAVFSGSGHTLPFLYSCIIAKWVCMLPYAWIVVKILSLPIYYLWISILVSDIIESFVMYISFARGTWKQKNVRSA